MNSIIKVLPNYRKYNDYIENVKMKTSPIMLSGLTDSGKIHFAYSTGFYTEQPICIVTYNEIQAKKIIKDLEYFEEEILYFPKREVFAYDYIAESKDNFYQRINVLNKIHSNNAKIIVTTIEALMQKIVPRSSLYKNILKLKVGQIFDLTELKEKLVLLGYERYDLVEAGGQFSSRGGIIDIALSEKQGVRIEFWGDEIDSIRYFNISTQRSTEMLKEVEIYPSHEFILEESLDKICEKIVSLDSKYEDIYAEDIETIKQGNYIEKVDRYFNSFYEKQETLIDYLNNNYIIFLDEASKLKARSENIIKDSQNIIKTLVEKKRIIPNSITNLIDYLKVLELIKNRQTIYLERQDIGFIDKQTMHAKRNGYSFSYREVNFFRSSMDLLFEEVQKAKLNEKTIVILGGNADNAQKISSLLTEQNIPNIYTEKLNIEITPGEVVVSTGAISAGFECFDFNLLVITGEELFSAPKKKRVMQTVFKQGEAVVFADLKPRRLCGT